MNKRRPEYLVPALIGGTIAGVLSGIPLVNCLCCLWILGGAILATYLLAKNTPGPLTSGDGAIVGALAGIAAAVVDSFIGIPLRTVNTEFVRRMMERLSEFVEDMPSGWQTYLDRDVNAFSVSMFLLGLFIAAAVFAVLGVLGGVIGVSLFGRRKPPVTEGAGDAPQNPGDRQP